MVFTSYDVVETGTILSARLVVNKKCGSDNSRQYQGTIYVKSARRLGTVGTPFGARHIVQSSTCITMIGSRVDELNNTKHPTVITVGMHARVAYVSYPSIKL